MNWNEKFIKDEWQILTWGNIIMIIVGIITDLEEKEEVERIAKLFIFGQRIRKLSHKWLYAPIFTSTKENRKGRDALLYDN